MAEFVLHVPDIDEVGKDYTFELPRAWVDAQLADASLHADPKAASGSAQVHAQQNGVEFLVTGSLRAQLVTECVRCLGEAVVPVDVELAALYTRGVDPAHVGRSKRKPEPLELDDEDDDLQRETFTGNDIVLDELVREHLVLEVPMQPLCSEDCQGIAVPEHLRPPADTFGAAGAGAIDPRLAPLQRLRDNVPPNSADPAVQPGSSGRGPDDSSLPSQRSKAKKLKPTNQE
jgi:uncharacterized protein